jgi:hypothetical protein
MDAFLVPRLKCSNCGGKDIKWTLVYTGNYGGFLNGD